MEPIQRNCPFRNELSAAEWLAQAGRVEANCRKLRTGCYRLGRRVQLIAVYRASFVLKWSAFLLSSLLRLVASACAKLAFPLEDVFEDNDPSAAEIRRLFVDEESTLLGLLGHYRQCQIAER
jgi:hypothetical protein